MSDEKQILQRLSKIERLLEVEDLITADELCKRQNIARRTLQNKIYQGLLDGKYIVTSLGVKMFYWSRIVYP